MPIRRRRSISLRSASSMLWFILLAALVFWFASFVRFSIATVGAGHARYLFPVSATMSITIVVGLSQLVPSRWNRIPGLIIGSALLIYAALCPFVFLQPLYPALRVADVVELHSLTQTNTYFGSTLRLAGYQIDRSTAQAGTDIQLDLYWQALGGDRPDLFTELDLVDVDNNLIGRSRQWPAENGTSIQIWDPNTIYADSRTMRVADASPTGEARLILMVQNGRGGPNVVASHLGESIGAQVTLLTLHVQGADTSP